MTPEAKARIDIDKLLGQAGWHVCGMGDFNIHASQGVAIRGSLPAWQRPLPFLFESTGVETHFTNGLDPQPRARGVFAFFRPELFAEWLTYMPGAPGRPASNDEARTFLHRMRNMPQLVTEWGAGGASYRFSQDYAFSSPSTAAAVLLGRSANGRIEWKDAQGRTLKELQAIEAGV